MKQAIVLELHTGQLSEFEVSGIGFDGLLPKLDLFMLADFSFRYSGAARITLPGLSSFQDLLPPKMAAFLQPWMHKLEAAVPGSEEYLGKLARLLSFVGRQARGVPDGAHSPCKAFSVDAVTVRSTPGQVRPCGHNCMLTTPYHCDVLCLTSWRIV